MQCILNVNHDLLFQCAGYTNDMQNIQTQLQQLIQNQQQAGQQLDRVILEKEAWSLINAGTQPGQAAGNVICNLT